MRSVSLLSFALFALSACNNPGEKIAGTAGDSTAITGDSSRSVSATPPTANNADTSLSGCYTYTQNRDTVSFQVESRAGTLSGPLGFNYYEKDRNTGTFTGELAGDTLIGWYLFKSEGTMSLRQEIFRKVGQELWPAMGERTERNDSMLFTNPSAVRFEQKMALRKVPCML